MTRKRSECDEMKMVDMNRIAIDQSGSLGSLYDRYQDTILGKLNADLKTQLLTLSEPTICRLYKGRTAETQNLLKMVDINRSLRLSIASKMVQPTGIASLIDYPHSIDRYTRFLYFHHASRQESCHDYLMKNEKSLQLSKLETSATHIIATVVWGIHVVVVMQLPPAQQTIIDELLDQIQENLIHDDFVFLLDPMENFLFNQIISTTVYSNIPDLNKLTKLDDIWQTILKIKNSHYEHHRLKYFLIPIRPCKPKHIENTFSDVKIDSTEIEHLENYLLQQSSELKTLKLRIGYDLPESLQGQLDEQLTDARRILSEIQIQHEEDIEQMRHSIVYIRKEDSIVDAVDPLAKFCAQTKNKESIQILITVLDELLSKSNLIKQLQGDGFEYSNVVRLGIDQGCDQDLIQKLLFKSNPNRIVFCSLDLLKNKFEEEWNNLYAQVIEEHKRNPTLTLVYADFTYSTFHLEKMEIVMPKEQTILSYDSKAGTTSHETKSRALTPLPPPSADEYINILLIGESGVGKSTFINAFANYLQFDTIQQAQAGEPTVVIPVSFLMTINNNFDEKLVKFGDIDPNEDHNNSGQSVTQQCRSYVFELSPGKKLRVIDTPGFGDTGGEHQDDLNMEVIFSFLNHFTYLNGVCLLFKPNAAQLNRFMYSCFTQLFQYFGEAIRDHFIFCFTNARSTFFAPGDTRPLLQAFFKDFPVKGVPLEKKNTFCFDSESFRYLVAQREKLTFSADDKNEFEKSWTRSVTESKRFRRFLCEELHPYRKNAEWRSIQDAQYQINQMIRPMLEAMRNILRNIILCDSKTSIKLSATCVDRPTVICYKCHRAARKCGPFWILPDHLHAIPNEVSMTSVFRNLFIKEQKNHEILSYLFHFFVRNYFYE
jgi:GTP-binding protein EngB required for normal cell division